MIATEDGLRYVEGRVAFGGWLKYLFRGDLLDLERAAGEIQEVTREVLDRECVIATVRGLRAGEPFADFVMVVDVQDGIIMELERADAEILISVEKLETATAEP